MSEGGTSIETYSAGAGRDVASMVDNEHLKCTATLLLYITLESAVSRTNFPRFCYLNFLKFTFLGFYVVDITREHLSIDVSITNVGLNIDEAMVTSFLGVRTDTVLESSYGNMSAHKKFQLKAQN